MAGYDNFNFSATSLAKYSEFLPQRIRIWSSGDGISVILVICSVIKHFLFVGKELPVLMEQTLINANSLDRTVRQEALNSLISLSRNQSNVFIYQLLQVISTTSNPKACYF